MVNDRFLLCKPTYFSIDYEINTWMKTENKVDQEKSIHQWEALYDQLSNLATVELIEPVPNLPDMVFTANSGFIFGKKVILSNFYHPERKGEEEHFKKWFIEHGYSVHKSSHCFEGAGDAFIINDKIYAGHNQRSSYLSYKYISEFCDKNPIWCRLGTAQFYHLDTCFCPLRDKDVLWYEGSFDNVKNHPVHELNVIHVSKEEAQRFACNAVLVNDEHVLIPSGCPQTIDNLNKLGYTTHELEMSEFMKSGGACKCLTLKL